MKIKRTIKTDVLVIGGGGAGERAAYEAQKLGAKVAIVVKGKLAQSGCTTRAVSELSAYSAAFAHTDPRDNTYMHFRDTVYQGHGLCNEKLVRIFVNSAPKRMLELDKMGCQFVKEDGKYQQLLADASTIPRACHFGADTGRQIAGALKEQLSKANTEIYENIIITKLLTYQNAVTGAMGFDFKDGGVVIFKAKSTVLATGGGGQVYSLSGQPNDITGDGISLATRVGAKLVNMEFIQFGPALIYPVTGYLLVTSFWKLKPRLYNKNGEEFLTKYLPEGLTAEEVIRSKEFAFPFIIDYPAMYLDIAIHSEVTSGRGSEHGGVYLDISHNDPEEIEKKVPVSFKWLLEHGIDIRKQPIEIAPVAQCFIGGVKYNKKAKTDIEGLFVCGEVSGGAHGAARPGGNLLAISQVFGYIAGKSAAERALPIQGVRIDKKQINQEIQRLNGFLESGDETEDLKNVIHKLRNVMWNNVSCVRNKSVLEKALNIINNLRKYEWPKVGANSVKSLRKIIELDFMLDVAKYIIISSLIRKESRGTFYRNDYPNMNNVEWLKVIELSKKNDDIEVNLRFPEKMQDFYI